MHLPLVQRLTMAEATFAVSYMGSRCQEDNSMLLYFVRPARILGADFFLLLYRAF
jgi:hypothetical protein